MAETPRARLSCSVDNETKACLDAWLDDVAQRTEKLEAGLLNLNERVDPLADDMRQRLRVG
jgi:hypothetical protein